MTAQNPATGPAAAEMPELAPGTLVEGKYRVVRLIGVGGTGVVYEVEHLRTSQRLALKTLLDPAQAPRLEQEGRALARLRSAHVVKVVDLGQSEVGPYLVMTLLQGRNLRDVLEAKVKLGLAFVANMTVQVCEGLDEAHRVGLVHRDLKPENIHLSDPNDADPKSGQPPHDLSQATVFDFGVVKMATAEPTSALTRTGSTVGTPYYMSLEQLRGSDTVDARSDVYAFCVLLYECFAGVRPFEAGTLGDLIYAICSTTPQHLMVLRPDLPREIIDTVMKGLSRQKDERPKSMRELARAFAPLADPGYTVWLRTPEPPMPAPIFSSGPALPPALAESAAPKPAALAPPAVAAAAPPATATGSTATTPQRLPRPTERLIRPVVPTPSSVAGGTPAPSAPTGAGGTNRPPAPARPPPRPPAAPPGHATRAVAAPDPSLLGSGSAARAEPSILAEPSSSLDGTTPVEEVPPGAMGGEVRDRETPTEMFVREVHGDTPDDTASPVQVPTMALSVDGVPRAPFAGEPDPSTIDAADKTAVLDMSSVGATASTVGAAPPAAPAFGPPPTSSGRGFGGPAPSPPNGRPAAGFTPSPNSGVHSLARASSANLDPPLTLQGKIDFALSSLGSKGNKLGSHLLTRFRAASQEQQIVIVVVLTATIAVFVVGLVYLIVF